MVSPSAVTSNGTETTEIEDELAKEELVLTTGDINSVGSGSSQALMTRLSTDLPHHRRSSAKDESISVIYAPEGQGNYKVPLPQDISVTPVSRFSDRNPSPTPYQEQDALDSESPLVTQAELEITCAQPLQTPIYTDVAPIRFEIDSANPRAQTKHDFESLVGECKPVRLSSVGNLEGIPEQHEAEYSCDACTVQNSEQLNALDIALKECWTLCNTFARLSSIHRERIFSYSRSGDAHEKAWKSCWRLCQKLYDSRHENHEVHIRPTLDHCRDFCQALFYVRERKDEIADSVLRVSFELSNYLYNTRARTLPEAVRERTLDFYITLCHRFMKQRSELPEETDALLRASWGLAEMLFSLRQNKREGKLDDEELLSSTLQACWELCNIFREGWTQVRSKSCTSRSFQTPSIHISDQMSRSLHSQSSNSLLRIPYNAEHPDYLQTQYIPETPTTQFDDTYTSSEEDSPNMPNILVLGSEGSRSSSTKWSSTSCSVSTYSQGRNTSSNVTPVIGAEDINLTRVKILILKAAMNVGFSRTDQTTAAGIKSGLYTLQSFVKSLPSGSFGSLPAHATLLNSYRQVVLRDPTFSSSYSLPAVGEKANAGDVAKSVGWMIKIGQYTFLKYLFRLVFGFHVGEVEGRKNFTIKV